MEERFVTGYINNWDLGIDLDSDFLSRQRQADKFPPALSPPTDSLSESIPRSSALLRIQSKAVLQSLEWVGLTDKIKSRPAQLSGGECQRVSIARAMVKKPKLVLADEPTANLDAHNSHNILETMEKLNQELKTTFIFSTHDEKVIQYLRRTIVLKDGQVVSDDNVAKN